MLVVHSFSLLNNMPSKPEMLSFVKFFFLFPSLPHPKCCQFYFLHLSQIHSLLSLLVPLHWDVSHLVCVSSFLTDLPCSPQSYTVQLHRANTLIAPPLQASVTPTLLQAWLPPFRKSSAPWSSQPSVHPVVPVYIQPESCLHLSLLMTRPHLCPLDISPFNSVHSPESGGASASAPSFWGLRALSHNAVPKTFSSASLLFSCSVIRGSLNCYSENVSKLYQSLSKEIGLIKLLCSFELSSPGNS